MITGETTVANPIIILWDLNEGKRLASLRPHSTALCSAAFSPSGSMLVTVGLDPHNRIQISLWDVQAMIREKGTIIGYKSSLAPGMRCFFSEIEKGLIQLINFVFLQRRVGLQSL